MHQCTADKHLKKRQGITEDEMLTSVIICTLERPMCVLSDFSEAQIAAVEDVFAGIVAYAVVS